VPRYYLLAVRLLALVSTRFWAPIHVLSMSEFFRFIVWNGDHWRVSVFDRVGIVGEGPGYSFQLDGNPFTWMTRFKFAQASPRRSHSGILTSRFPTQDCAGKAS